MVWSKALILAGLLILSGCATQQSKNPHVLSGEAPVEDVIAKADESLRAGDFRAAAILYQIAIGEDAQADYWYKLGVANAGLKQHSKAIYAYLQAVGMDEGHAGALEKLALHFTAKGDAEEAGKYLNRLLEVDPDNWKAHNALGVLADRREAYAEARSHYLKALQLRPDLAMLWSNLGYSVYLLDEFEQAAVYMKRALELDPAFRAARLNLALVHIRQAQYDAALAVLAREGGLAKAEEFLLEAINQSPTFNRPAHTYLAAARQARE
jgi:Flp pilus assembly protein TadD